jgi:hypothetical protein
MIGRGILKQLDESRLPLKDLTSNRRAANIALP